MMNKKRFLKSVLTTTTLAATLLGASQSAMGAAIVNASTAGGPHAMNLTTGGNTGAGALLVNGSVEQLTTIGDSILANVAAGVFGVDLHNLAGAPGIINVSQNSTLIGVWNANGANTQTAQFSAGATLTLNGAGAVGLNAAYTANNLSLIHI